MNRIIYFLLTALFFPGYLFAQSENPEAKEADYYRITTIPVPQGIDLEVGGIASIPDGSMAVCTRRGDVWIIDNPTLKNNRRATFHLYASGLHEPLGLLYHEGDLITAQRGELTRLKDTNGDRIADYYETITDWPVTGDYHEYSFGPVLAPDGDFYVTTNINFSSPDWWHGKSQALWRGWTLKISPDGKIKPWATGMRSPAGLGMVDGELFYTDNQGDWVGSGGIWHIEEGDFFHHPAGLVWADHPDSPVKARQSDILSRIDLQRNFKGNTPIKPTDTLDDQNSDMLYQFIDTIPGLKTPAVWLPHGIMGISNSEIIKDKSNGLFGPFAGQVFVGDQGQSKVMRVALEKVDGQFQGVAFDFRKGFQSGAMRLEWDKRGQLFVGETNRGWGSAGTTNSGIEFLTWTGKTPFEMYDVKAMSDGFEITFTQPVDRKLAEDLDSYSGKSYVYKYHPVYGSPPIFIEPLKIKGVRVSEDGKKARLVVDNLSPYHVHEIHVEGLRSATTNLPILHPIAYYTLNKIPKGAKLGNNDISTYSSAAALAAKQKAEEQKKATLAAQQKKKKIIKKPVAIKAKKKKPAPAAPTLAEVESLLKKNTCVACHKQNRRVVGPSYEAIAKRKYSNERIVELIYSPEPQNWPEYATPMAPMPQVPKKEALKIAAWINTLR